MVGRDVSAAAARVDGDVHQHTAGAHAAQHVATDQFRCLGPGHQHRADQKIHARQLLEDVRLAGVQRVGGVQRDVEKAHSLGVHLENGDVGCQAGGHPGGVDAGHAAAEHHHAPRQHARHTAEQDAGSTVVACQKIAADQHRHAPGDLAHRLEQRQAAVDLDCLVGQRGDAGAADGLGEFAVGGEVEV